ncbi:MAG TPA: hypothetical protein VES01_00480 [Dermatophilaceae bacterium]|nr:hypothetical protein [Dermatophilaceae bacterium]
MTATDWDLAVVAMEEELNLHEEALRKGQLAIVPDFTAPDDLGPLPPQAAARVAQLIRRIGLLATFVQFQLVATESDLRHLERGVGRPAGAVSLYLDASV